MELMEKIFATIKIATGVLHHVKEIKALEAGKMCLILEPITIQEVFGVAQTIFEDRMHAKEVKLSLEDLSSGETFLCHKSSFSNSVFNNFISNAIKFSPRGSEIKVKSFIENDIYHITITDQGIGIPEEIANNLFDIGKATSRTGTDGESGTGFGMNLAKTYMEQYRGELRFSTQVTGKTGTTFELLLQKAS
jgi:signal transduction histidine kinase